MDPRPFLHDLASRPFRWGHTDCALVLADYWLWATRRNADPAADLRGAYTTEEECERVLREHGGLLRLVSGMARDLGAERVAGPDYPPGCVAVVRFMRRGERTPHFGAIRTPGGRWAVKCWDGLTMVRDAHVAAAWRV